MKSSVSRPRRRGFTLLEMTIAGFLMALVAGLLGHTWVAFGRPAISAVARARLAREANLFTEALARDVGRLACPEGTRTDSRYQKLEVADAGKTLNLTLDEGTGEIRTISYSIDEGDPSKLFRTDSGKKRVIATFVDVAGFHCETLPVDNEDSAASGVRIDLTLRHRANERDSAGSPRADHTRRYRLFIPDPHP